MKFRSIYYAGNILIRHLCEHDTDILFTAAFKMAELYRFIQICPHGTSKKSIVIGHIALLFITDNLKTHESTYCHTEYKFITIIYYIYTKMDNKMKERNCVDKYRSKCKKRWDFHGYKTENVTTTQSESMHMQNGEE